MDTGFLARLTSLQAEKAKLALRIPESDVSSSVSWEREVYTATNMPIAAVSEDDFVFPLSELAESGHPTRALRIHESHTTIGGRVWDGGIFLARNLQKAAAAGDLVLDGKVVLELGAGTGARPACE